MLLTPYSAPLGSTFVTGVGSWLIYNLQSNQCCGKDKNGTSMGNIFKYPVKISYDDRQCKQNPQYFFKFRLQIS